MNLKESKGIVIRSMKFSETSLILDIYSLHFGLRSYIVNGVRKSKTRFSASMLQLLNIIDFSAYPSESEKLSRIKEFSPAYKYQNLTFEVIKTSVGVFMIELLRNSIREKEENPSLYHFLEDQLIHLDNLDQKTLSTFYLSFMIKLTEYLGFFPMNNYDERHPIFDLLNGRFVPAIESSKYTLDPGMSLIFYHNLSAPGSAEMGKAERQELTDHLLTYYSLHIPDFRPIKSLEVLRAIMK